MKGHFWWCRRKSYKSHIPGYTVDIVILAAAVVSEFLDNLITSVITSVPTMAAPANAQVNAPRASAPGVKVTIPPIGKLGEDLTWTEWYPRIVSLLNVRDMGR